MVLAAIRVQFGVLWAAISAARSSSLSWEHAQIMQLTSTPPDKSTSKGMIRE